MTPVRSNDAGGAAHGLVDGPRGGTRAPAELSRTVLVVDDEPSIRYLIRRWLEARGCEILTASNAEEAIAVIAGHPTAVAVCDLRLPGHDGLWLADRIRAGHPDTAIILVTGFHDVELNVAAMGESVQAYLTKPFDRERFCEAVRRGQTWHRSARDSRRWRDGLDRDVRHRRDRLEQAFLDHAVSVDVSEPGSVEPLLAAVTANDPAQYAHAHRVAALAGRVATVLRLGAAETRDAQIAALFHDLGKMAVPVALLRKPAPLTAEELALVRRSRQIGADLVARVPGLERCAMIVGAMHERLDGSPAVPIARAAVPLLPARIVTVADVFDTMTHPRVYRDTLDQTGALAEIDRGCGTQFDPVVVDALRQVIAPVR